jgi:hypothetical protein
LTTFEAVAPVDRIMCGDSLERILLAAMARERGGDTRSRVPLLGRRGLLPEEERWAALARDAHAEAIPHEMAGSIDAEAVAAWITGHYPDATYPAVVLGSAHGSAVHLAAALDAAWLPTSFRATFTWPGGDAGDWRAALAWGERLAERIIERNPGLSVRQVHDPLQFGALSAATVTLHLRWRTLPRAYREMLSDRVDMPGGAALLFRDLRTWPVVIRSPRFGFQLGSPAGGWSPGDYTASLGTPPDSQRRYAEIAGEPALGADLTRFAAGIGLPVHRALYTNPGTLSACVADLFRRWLRAGGADGDRCVVESGRLLDPWQVLAGGVVPYWCESAARSDVEAAEWWLAGSETYDTVTVLPDAPGSGASGATLAHWRSLSLFGRERADLDRQVASRYPALPMAAAHATRVLAEAGGRPGSPPAMTVLRVVRGLQRSEAGSGMLVS